MNSEIANDLGGSLPVGKPLPQKRALFGQTIVVLGMATFLGLLFANEGYLLSRVNFGTSQIPKALWWNLMDWYAWAALVPGIVWVCRSAGKLEGRPMQVLALLGAGAIFAFAHGAILTSAAWIETSRPWFYLWTNFFVVDHTFKDFFTYVAIACAWYAFANYRMFRDRELRAAQLESRLVRAELQSLKMQLNPHFLFNTLHSISALNYEDPREANRMLARLSDLLRESLADEPAQGSTLGREVELSRQYLELEKMRLGERLSFETETSAESLAAHVPTFFLQPLVENAVRHGIAPYKKPGSVWIRSRLRDGMLDLEVGDNGTGGMATPSPSAGHGIGLRNTRLRLEMLYGDRHTFEVLPGGPTGFIVRMTIPFERVG